MEVTPNLMGHYPAGYPKGARAPIGGAAVDSEVMRSIEAATDQPDLSSIRTAVQQAVNDSAGYLARCDFARDWWYARWPGQTVDGRKWGDDVESVWPWPGASDTRVRMVEKIIGQYRTLATFAFRNMKVQARSTRPAATIRESQQATTLLNWMLFSHMRQEMYRELRLGTSWKLGYGSALLELVWMQTRRLDRIELNILSLQEFVNEPAVASFLYGPGGSENLSKIPFGENLSIGDLQEMIMDKTYEGDLVRLLRAVSQNYLSQGEARRKLEQLREARTVEVPVPYVFESRPRVCALRPMVDVIFPPWVDDLQRSPFIDRIEFVSETELRDRIDTAGYSREFVEEALQRRGPQIIKPELLLSAMFERGNVTRQYETSIELHHFHSLAHDRGVPVRFCTVFHMGVDVPAYHAPEEYEHGQACYHPMRREVESRPILSSRGIPEIAYTWEQEVKKQRDARTDRADLALRPPLITTYDKLLKTKQLFAPGAIWPMRRADEGKWFLPPPWDNGSIEIERTVEAMVREYFGIFGQDIDPSLKQMRQEEFVDDTLAELRPVLQQMMKLMRQYLPDSEVASVVGPLQRPFHIDRSDIQGEFEISGTVDLRNADPEFLKEKLPFLVQLAQLDDLGLLDKATMLRIGAEAIDYTLADELVRDPQPATAAEIQDEQRAIDLIIGSGQDQPLPQGGNYRLRLQTLISKVQSISQNPATLRIIQNNPDIMKVIENRAAYFQRQIQQQQNALIGRMQVSNTFTKDAPQVQDYSSMLP
jgi:hypothetical protein